MFSMRDYARDVFGGEVLAFDCEDDAWAYRNAVRAFGRTGDRAGLLRALLSLGVSGAPAARWHLENPGEVRVCVF